MPGLFSSLLTKIAGLGSATAVRLWMRTLDYQAAYYDRSIDPAFPECRQPAIYLFWHENILFPLYLRGRNNLAMLLSRHRDADVLSRVALHMGFDVVRGSTYRGSVTAVRELLRRGRNMHLTITPDGPRGPRRRLAQGPIYLSSKLGLPLVLMGFGYDRPWRLPTWDRFAVPRPGSRARAVVSGHVQIPQDLSREGIEHYRKRVERLLERLSLEAECWAQSRTTKQGQLPCFRQPAAPRPNELGRRSPDTTVYPLRRAG
ncbi:MAG: lysophospholipid acyltransferase family protein [Pirellulales bacterium]